MTSSIPRSSSPPGPPPPRTPPPSAPNFDYDDPTWYKDLLVAASSSSDHVAQVLALGGDPDVVRTKLGRRTSWPWDGSPLHEAAKRGHAESVKLLVEAGVPVDCVEVNGHPDCSCTALHVAVGVGGTKGAEVVRMLLSLGADPDKTGRLSVGGAMRTAVDLAVREEDDCVVNILREHKYNLARKVKDKAALQDVISKVKTMESELDRASKIDRQIEAKEQKIRDKEERIRAEQEGIRKHRKRIANLMKDKGYLTPLQKKSRMGEMDDIGVMQRTLLAATAKNDDGDDDRERGLTCTVCFSIPDKVFNCQECHNLVCEGCLLKIVACPTCRTDFLLRSPQRNVAMERVILASKKRAMKK